MDLPFIRWVFETLSKDERYQKNFPELIGPSERDEKKAQVSSAAGAIVGKIIGIGWRSTLKGAAIAFKNYPIGLMTMEDHENEGKVKFRFYFSVNSGITRRNLHRKMEVKPFKKGIVNKQVAGITFGSYCIGKEHIENDRELMTRLYQLFKTNLMCNISDWTSAPMTVEIIEKSGMLVGEIEAAAEATLGEEHLKLLFECATKIAEDVQSSLQNRTI